METYFPLLLLSSSDVSTLPAKKRHHLKRGISPVVWLMYPLEINGRFEIIWQPTIIAITEFMEQKAKMINSTLRLHNDIRSKINERDIPGIGLVRNKRN